MNTLRYRLELKTALLNCNYSDDITREDLSRVSRGISRELTRLAKREERHANPSRVQCIETGRVYSVYAIKQPERVDIMPMLPYRLQMEKQAAGIRRVYATTPLTYVIEDEHGNLAGELVAEDCVIV